MNIQERAELFKAGAEVNIQERAELFEAGAEVNLQEDFFSKYYVGLRSPNGSPTCSNFYAPVTGGLRTPKLELNVGKIWSH